VSKRGTTKTLAQSVQVFNASKPLRTLALPPSLPIYKNLNGEEKHMKSKLMRVALASLLSIACSAAAFADTYGLFVGISDYPDVVKGAGKVENNDLKGPVNDVAKAKSVFTNSLGVNSKNITTLLDAQATSAKFLSGLETVLGKLEAGDTFVLYFSGHGTTVKSKDGSNKLIQALVLQDYSLLANEELGSLRKSLVGAGIKTVFILDSCFAGGMDRPLPGITVKGKEYSEGRRLLAQKALPQSQKLRTVKTKSVAKKITGAATIKQKSAAQAGSVLLLASQADQTSIDLNFKENTQESRGLFSLLLFAILEEAPTATVYEIMQAIEEILKEEDLISRQRPRLVLYGSASKNTKLIEK
jgi:hypothetical protein